MLTISNVHKTFFPGTANERTALAGVDLDLAEGDFCTIIGSNGAGKSTLLNTVAGRLRPDTGSVHIDGTDITRMKEHQLSLIHISEPTRLL